MGAFELLEGARAFLAQADERLRARFRFLHVSTDEVYGTLGKDGLFCETTPYAPNSPYAATKMKSPSTSEIRSGLTFSNRLSGLPSSIWNWGRVTPASPSTMPENDSGP